MPVAREDNHCSPRDAAAGLQSGAMAIVDVRERLEHRSGTIGGAIEIPLSGLRRRRTELPRDRPIVFVCRSGHRSRIAAAMARRDGIDARTLDGGFLAYQRAGLPTVTEPKTP